MLVYKKKKTGQMKDQFQVETCLDTQHHKKQMETKMSKPFIAVVWQMPP